MKITNADDKMVLLKVAGVNITKYSEDNASVIADTDSKLSIKYTRDGVLYSVNDTTNGTTDTFDTNSTGSLILDLTAKVNTIRANSSYSDFNTTIEDYFNTGGTYSVQSCLSTNVELKDNNDFTKLMTIDGTQMRCVDGNITQ